MTYQHAVNYITNAPKYKRSNSVAGLCEWFTVQNIYPAPNTNIVSISGTVGTSSCAVMLTGVLNCAEYRVGRLLNSHVFDFRERITIDNKPIEHSVFAEHTGKISKYIKRAKKNNPKDTVAQLSTDEIMLAIAMAYFTQNECDIIIIDCGCPENLNLLAALPPCTVNIITSIENNYNDANQTEQNLKYVLSGIHKGMHEIICNIRQSNDFNKLSSCCSMLGCRITIPAQAELQVTKNALKSLDFTYRGRQYNLSLSAHYCITNAITVIEAAYALRRVGMIIKSVCIEKGLSTVYLAARFDILSIAPTIIADCATTPLQIVALSESLKRKKQLFDDIPHIKLFANKDTAKLFIQTTDIFQAENVYILDESTPTEIDCATFYTDLQNTIKSQNPHQILLCIGTPEYIGKTIFLIKRILNER